MPHVIVKLWPGKSEQQKKTLAQEITQAVMTTLSYGEESVSKPKTIYKKPGYDSV